MPRAAKTQPAPTAVENTPPKLKWVFKHGPEVRDNGVWVAYGALNYGFGYIYADGSYATRKGNFEADSIDQAKRIITQEWEEGFSDPKPLTDAQKLAAYKRILISRAASNDYDDQRDVASALKTVERCGWLEDLPELDPFMVTSYTPEPMIVKLVRLGKLNLPDEMTKRDDLD